MIQADSQPEQFLTQFTNGEHSAAADTTADKGGGNRGFRPHELLEAALATCMNMSLRMYAQKHALPLTGASVMVSLDRNAPEGPTFVYRVILQGPLGEQQKSQLLSAVESCPVRATLSKDLRFTPATDG
jgi:putative redox protein